MSPPQKTMLFEIASPTVPGSPLRLGSWFVEFQELPQLSLPRARTTERRSHTQFCFVFKSF